MCLLRCLRHTGESPLKIVLIIVGLMRLKSMDSVIASVRQNSIHS